MIVTPRFVFLHLHKSGGTFVNACLMQHVVGARHIGYHLPRRLIPPEFRTLPVLGLVRNPWSYYVSWYAFQKARLQPNALFRVLSDDGALNFGDTVRRMLDLCIDESLLARVIDALPTEYTNQGLNLPGSALAPIRNSGLGFYSLLYRYLYGEEAGVVIGHMERLREELPRMLETVHEPVSADMQSWIDGAPIANPSQHAAYEQYYDQALADLVRRRDGAVIERHGYTYGSG